MEKYGFVYLWYDKKHKRYYLGCHWGFEDDGYICSSRWMRKSYRRRPHDFKRRIISRIYTSRIDLLEEEFKYLQMIKPDELSKRYYNLHNHHFNHWSTDEETSKKVRIKNSDTIKERHKDPEYREKFLNGRKKLRGIKQSEETKEKRRKSMINAMEKKYPKEDRKQRVPRIDSITGEYTTEYIEAISNGVNEYYKNITDEDKLKRSKRLSVANKGKKMRLGHKNTKEHNLGIAKANGKIVIIDGVEYYSMYEASRNLNVSHATVRNRINSNKYPTWGYKTI